MVSIALQNAWAELTLVLFTAIAPAGAVAAALMCVPRLRGNAVSEQMRASFDWAVVMPLTVALVGLVCSTTHLGNPANALYVITRIGSSPLSNEVGSAVVFFGIGGTYWFASFSPSVPELARRIWAVAVVISAAVFVVFVGLAYHVDTIITWYSPYVPANLYLNAVWGGCLLALAGGELARRRGGFAYSARRLGVKLLLAIAAAVFVANIAAYALQGMAFSQLGNAIGDYADFVPCYGAALVAFAALGACAIGVDVWAVARRRSLALSRTCTASALAIAAIFIMRFVFYMSHMTVGLAA